MDSTRIAIHVVLQDKVNSTNDQNITNQNRLYCSVSHPSGANIPNIRSNYNPSIIQRSGTASLGMVTNAIASTNSAPTATGFSKSERLGQGTSPSDWNNNIVSKLNEANMALNKNLKKMGWYWGSISPEFASKLLKDEQDGSFLIRDSSSDCYIFSMTLKLANEIHHTRIEHSSGYFSFGRSRKFYCTTMVDFIEQAIECSRSGDLSFFLHRGPEIDGPQEFKMIPLSRMNGSNSLKHLCRFAILPYVRKDKINELCLPESLRDYLYEPFKSSGHILQET